MDIELTTRNTPTPTQPEPTQTVGLKPKAADAESDGLETQTYKKPSKHVNRNEGMVCPAVRPEMDDPRWHVGETNDYLISVHFHGADHYDVRGLVPENRGFQCVYDENLKLILDGRYAGTYDYSPPYKPDNSVAVFGYVGHVFKDMLPAVFWGESDPRLIQVDYNYDYDQSAKTYVSTAGD